MVEFKRVPDYADVMTAETWANMVQVGVFNPDDGVGFWCAGELRQTDVNSFTPRPSWATHVAWYNC